MRCVKHCQSSTVVEGGLRMTTILTRKHLWCYLCCWNSCTEHNQCELLATPMKIRRRKAVATTLAACGKVRVNGNSASTQHSEIVSGCAGALGLVAAGYLVTFQHETRRSPALWKHSSTTSPE